MPEKVREAPTGVKQYKDLPFVGKFRLLHGRHSEGGMVYSKGDVFESKKDLETLNTISAKKFERVDSKGKKHHYHATAEEAAERAKATMPPHDPLFNPGSPPLEDERPEDQSSEEDGEDQPEGEEEDLDAMTVAELRELAEAEEIDLGGAHLKADVVKAVKKARKGR